MPTSLLLDTCALIWAAEDTLSEASANALTRSAQEGLDVMVSPITAWEMGMLISRGRLTSPMSPYKWFEQATSAKGIKLAELSPLVLIRASFLPGRPPRDPADRIIAATAREGGWTVVTPDRELLAYAGQGHIQALPC